MPPVSLRRCRSSSLSSFLASASAWRVFSLCLASSAASALLCSARPSAFLASSPVIAPAASFILPLAFSDILVLQSVAYSRIHNRRTLRINAKGRSPSEARTPARSVTASLRQLALSLHPPHRSRVVDLELRSAVRSGCKQLVVGGKHRPGVAAARLFEILERRPGASGPVIQCG